jgi:hypothetical protein
MFDYDTERMLLDPRLIIARMNYFQTDIIVTVSYILDLRFSDNQKSRLVISALII